MARLATPRATASTTSWSEEIAAYNSCLTVLTIKIIRINIVIVIVIYYFRITQAIYKRKENYKNNMHTYI
jgi:hypothetical protein